MKRIISYALMSFMIFCSISYKVKALGIHNNKNYTICKCTKYIALKDNSMQDEAKQDILCLMMAYDGYIQDIESGKDGHIYLFMKSGRKILYDDGKEKNFDTKLYNPDIQDMMEQNYPLNSTNNLMDNSFDPGRFRVYNLLYEVYGRNRNEIESNLKNVNTGYGSCQFNGSNGAADALKSVMKELMPLVHNRNDIRACVFPLSGTYNYRVISGTNMLSPHSFGIAIDLARDKRDYWKWASREQGQKRLSVYPKEIVEIFEKNNFIWGGKWGHFDILHFEYRPELILKARYFNDENIEKNNWYDGAPYNDYKVKEYIEKIDNAYKTS